MRCAWGAQDEGGTIYLYAEHLFPHAEPSQNARAIKANGDWIPGVMVAKGSKVEQERIARIYRELGLTIQASSDAEEAGMYQLWQVLASNKLKVFASLSGFLEEYRIGDEGSPLLLCCQALMASGRQYMRTKPSSAPAYYSRPYRGERDWMG